MHIGGSTFTTVLLLKLHNHILFRVSAPTPQGVKMVGRCRGLAGAMVYCTIPGAGLQAILPVFTECSQLQILEEPVNFLT